MNTKKYSVYKFLHLFAIILVLIMGYGLLFLGAYYSNPNAEDFSLVVKSRDLGLIPSIMEVLNTYDGRYFVNLLHGINPLALGSLIGYKFTIAFGIVFPIFCLSYFLKSVWQNLSHFNTFLFSSLFMLVNYALSPSLPHLVYWMVSSFVYLYSWCFWLLWVGSFIRYLKAPSFPSKDIYFILTIVFLICAMGMNEMFLILHGITLALFILHFTLTQSPHLKFTIPIASVAIIMLLFFISNAGIETRYQSFDELRSENHFILSFVYLAKHASIALIDWLSFGLIFLVLLFWTILFVGDEDELLNYKLEMKWYYSLPIFISPFAMLLAFYIPMGESEVIPNRIFTSFFLVIQFLLVFVFSSYFNTKTLTLFKREKIAVAQIRFALVIALALSLTFTQNNLNILAHEYASGVLINYDQTMKKRYEIIKSAKNKQKTCWKVAILPPLVNPPKSIYMNPDIKANKEGFFWNNAYEKFFGLDEVRLEGDTFYTPEAIQLTLNE